MSLMIRNGVRGSMVTECHRKGPPAHSGGHPAPLPPGESGNLPVTQSTKRSAWFLLRQHDFRLYFTGSLISNLGTWLQSTAQILLAYKISHSVFTVGLIAFAQFAGVVMLSPYAAVLADRFGAKAVLISTQAASATVALWMAWRSHDGLLGVHTLLIGALELGCIYALALPVQTALMPALVDPADAASAVKLNSVSYNAGRALAPALCVPVIMLAGPELIFAINAVSFTVFALCLANIVSRVNYFGSSRKLPEYRDSVGGIGRHARATDGLRTALRRPRILLLLAIVAAVTLADDPILVLSPALAHARLHVSGVWAGYFIAALGWGSVMGSLPRTSGSGDGTRRASRLAAFGLLFLGVSVVVFAGGFSAEASLLAAFAAGAAALVTGSAAQTALLSHHRDSGATMADMAGVAALWAIAWAGTKPFASLLDGWLAARIGLVPTSVVLVLPAMMIALLEILLPPGIKQHIRDVTTDCIRHVLHAFGS